MRSVPHTLSTVRKEPVVKVSVSKELLAKFPVREEPVVNRTILPLSS